MANLTVFVDDAVLSKLHDVCVIPNCAWSLTGRTLMSSKTTAASIESDSALVTPPANAKTVIPAANAPATPETLSSTTAHRSGDVPICSAANRKTSGAGFPCSTWSTLNMQPSKRSRSPVLPNVKRIFSWLPLDATQTGMLISSSASTMPGTATSSRSNTLPISRLELKIPVDGATEMLFDFLLHVGGRSPDEPLNDLSFRQWPSELGQDLRLCPDGEAFAVH